MSSPYHAHFRRADPTLHAVMRRVGPFTLKQHRDRFQALVRSIVSQQLSTKAARTIFARLSAAVPGERLTPEAVSELSKPQLRACGLSSNKAAFVHDLADKVASGQLQLKTLGRKSDADVIAALTEVHGIGEWTAHMFLIFSLGRLDVFPYGDLGVRAALRNLYQLKDLPDKETSCRIAAPWRPYSSVGAWYCWRSLELKAS